MDRLVARTPQVFRERYDIDARVLHEAVEIDLPGRRVRVRRSEGGEAWWEPFDQLLVATGALPIAPAVPGVGAKGIYGLSTLQSGIEVRRVVDERRPQRAVIVGGGYIGLEMAEALLRRGIKVAMIEKMPQVMNTLDPDMGILVAEALRQAGVELYLSEGLSAFEVSGGRLRAVVSERRSLPADLAILGMGVRPNSALAGEAGLSLGVKGGIVVDERMHTPVEGIWAAGDCVQSHHLVSSRPFYVALGTVANKQGRVAGINLGGGQATFPGVVGTAVTQFRELEVARTGLQEREIEELGLAYDSAKIEGRTRAGYYPGTERITVKLLFERSSGRLLGGQIVGGAGAGKRIDVLATALQARMTVQEMVHLDLGYAPPLATAWDALLLAARQATREM